MGKKAKHDAGLTYRMHYVILLIQSYVILTCVQKLVYGFLDQVSKLWVQYIILKYVKTHPVVTGNLHTDVLLKLSATFNSLHAG